MTDYRAISLPASFRRGLALLIRRALLCDATRDVSSLGEEKLVEAAQVVQALFGTEPLFGQMGQVTETEVREACKRVGVEPATELAPRTLVRLFASVDPSSAVCSQCGELPMNDVGGKLQRLGVGHTCPFCGQDQLRLTPIKLRQIAWTNGRLVVPGTDYDNLTVPGQRYPLRDEFIVEWAGDVHPELLEMLAEKRVSVYGLLAYLNLRRRAFSTLDDAARWLCDPHSFGITNRKQVRELALAAAAFVAEREVTNSDTPAVAYALQHDPSDAPRLVVAGRTYLVDGLVGHGDKCDVYRGFWEHRFTERVIIKVLAALEDADLLQREAATLRTLQTSQAQGADFFRHIIPELIAVGDFRDADGTKRPALVCRCKNLFDWTLADVMREYPEGVDAETTVWMWNRILLLLAWVHQNCFVHGAIVPEHVLLHPLNHGATLIDWSSAVRHGHGRTDIVSVVCGGREAFYPSEVLEGRPPSPETDIAMSARCIIAAAGGDPATGQLPPGFPAPIARLLKKYARVEPSVGELVADAFDVQEEFKKAAFAVFGKPRYHVFKMPREK